MEIVVVGRHTDVADRFRRHVEDKLGKVTQYAPKAQRVDVEVTREKNPRQSAHAERIELTVVDKGPVIRAEAAAEDRYAALDLATAKLTERLRRARDRRKDHRNYVVDIPAELPPGLEPAPLVEEEDAAVEPVPGGEAVEIPLGDSPIVIRRKVHEAEPMSIDEAIDQMELIGHDFFLFVDSTTNRPAVAYRRRGWTYGIIELETI